MSETPPHYVCPCGEDDPGKIAVDKLYEKGPGGIDEDKPLYFLHCFSCKSWRLTSKSQWKAQNERWKEAYAS